MKKSISASRVSPPAPGSKSSQRWRRGKLLRTGDGRLPRQKKEIAGRQGSERSDYSAEKTNILSLCPCGTTRSLLIRTAAAFIYQPESTGGAGGGLLTEDIIEPLHSLPRSSTGSLSPQGFPVWRMNESKVKKHVYVFYQKSKNVDISLHHRCFLIFPEKNKTHKNKWSWELDLK